MVDKIEDQKGKRKKVTDKYFILQLTLANVDNRVNNDEVYSFIEENLDGIQTYSLEPKSEYFAASFDYTLLIAVGSVAQLAEVLWMAYDRFIGRRKISPKDEAGIYIVNTLPNGSRTEFYIGKEYKDKDIFIRDFIDHIGELKLDPDSSSDAISIKSDIENNENWVKRK